MRLKLYFLLPFLFLVQACGSDSSTSGLSVVEEAVLDLGYRNPKRVKIKLPFKGEELKSLPSAIGAPFCKDVGREDFRVRVCHHAESGGFNINQYGWPEDKATYQKALDGFYEAKMKRYAEPDAVSRLPQEIEMGTERLVEKHGVIERQEHENIIEYDFSALTKKDYFSIRFNIKGDSLEYADVKDEINFIIKNYEK